MTLNATGDIGAGSAWQKVIGRRGRSLSWMLGMADYRGKFTADVATLREHSVMDTFDMLAPAYDRPQTVAMVRRWFEEAGLVDVEVHPGVNGLEARGKRPNQTPGGRRQGG